MFSNYYNFIPHLPLPSKDSEPLALELMDGYRHDELVEACRMVKERQGLEIDPDSIPVDDPLAFQLLRVNASRTIQKPAQTATRRFWTAAGSSCSRGCSMRPS